MIYVVATIEPATKRTVIENISCPMKPLLNATAATINENSLTCPKENPVIDADLFSYPKISAIIAISNGFTKITRSNSAMNRLVSSPRDVNCNWSPNETKKIVAKKSFNGPIIPWMFKLYFNGAMLIPAMNAPTAMENPK